MSVNVVIDHNPEGMGGPEHAEIPPGVTFLDWAMGKYGPDGFGVPTAVILNGQEVDLNDHAADGLPLSDGDVVRVVHRPQGVETAIVVAAAVVTLYLTSQALDELKSVKAPEVPDRAQEEQVPPNNRLTGQRNLARPLQRIPDNFGRNRLYPDLIALPVLEWVSVSEQELNQYFCLGRGEYGNVNQKVGDYDISGDPDYTVDFFGPDTLPTGIQQAFDTSAVIGQELPPPAAGPTPVPIGPFEVGGGEVEDIRINIEAPEGLQTGVKGSLNVTIKITVRLLTGPGGGPAGPTHTQFNGIAAAVNARIGSTIDISLASLAGFPASGAVEVELERVTSAYTGAGDRDKMVWGALYGFNPIGVSHFGDVTTARLRTSSGGQSDVTANSDKFNTVVIRKLRSYDTGTQSFTAAATTRKFADAVVEILTDDRLGGQSDSLINLDELYAIQDALDADLIYLNGELGLFNYSFGTDRTPVSSELATAANAARVFAYRKNGEFRFGRDEVKPLRSGLLNGRNKKFNSDIKTVLFQRPESFDGVRLEWVEEVTGDPQVVTFPEPPSAAPINPKKIEAAGIKVYSQAWNRAAVEWEKLQRERITVSVEATKDAKLLEPGNRVANVDLTRTDIFHGEVTAWEQVSASPEQWRIFTTEPIGTDTFNGSAILRDDEGDPVSYATAFQDGENSFIIEGALPTGIHARGDSGYQVGTTYALFKDNNDEAADYIVQRITSTSDPGYVKLELTNYDPDTWGPDTTEPT
jgi:hypothetical protein